MTNIRGQNYNPIYHKPTANKCPRCNGFLHEHTGGYSCCTCGYSKPPSYVKTTDSTMKEGENDA